MTKEVGALLSNICYFLLFCTVQSFFLSFHFSVVDKQQQDDKQTMNDQWTNLEQSIPLNQCAQNNACAKIIILLVLGLSFIYFVPALPCWRLCHRSSTVSAPDPLHLFFLIETIFSRMSVCLYVCLYVVLHCSFFMARNFLSIALLKQFLLHTCM